MHVRPWEFRMPARIRRLWEQQKNALVLIGIFMAIGVFLLLFGELLRANRIAIYTSGDIAELDAAWNRVQLQVVGAQTPIVAEAYVRYFKNRTLKALGSSRLSRLTQSGLEVAAILEGLRNKIEELGVDDVETAAAMPLGTDRVDEYLLSLQGWMNSFNAGQKRAFRILLSLYTVVLLAGIGVAMLFARDLWASQREDYEGRLLAQRFIRIQEDERRRIAAELHDEAAQSLASAAMIAGRAAEELDHHPLIVRLQEALDSSLTTIRQLSRDIGVPGLQGLPLEQAMDRLLADRAGELQVDVSYEGLSGANLSEEQKLHLYRIVQECVSNTVAHANAGRIELRLVHTYPNLVVRYADDGQGFDPADMDNERPHLGLRSMHERARMLSAELAVASKPGRGINVTMVMPVERT